MQIHKYILYADDDQDDREFLAASVAEQDLAINTVLFPDGLALIQFLEGIKTSEPLPGCILLDLNMPVWDGFKTLKTIRSLTKYQSIPIIIVTTSSSPKDHDSCLAMGADYFLTKPYSMKGFQELLETINRLLEKTDAVELRSGQ